MMELVALGTDGEAAAAVADELGGRAYVDHDGANGERPYAAMVRVATDTVEAVAAVADVALHVVYARQIKTPAAPASPDRVIASFPMRHRPELTHRQGDDHWRDIHGPLALVSHTAMCDYEQLSIVATLSGPALDGIAMCAFDSRDDLRHRFFDDDAAKAAVGADVAQWADGRRSPGRVVLRQIR